MNKKFTNRQARKIYTGLCNLDGKVEGGSESPRLAPYKFDEKGKVRYAIAFNLPRFEQAHVATENAKMKLASDIAGKGKKLTEIHPDWDKFVEAYNALLDDESVEVEYRPIQWELLDAEKNQIPGTVLASISDITEGVAPE